VLADDVIAGIVACLVLHGLLLALPALGWLP